MENFSLHLLSNVGFDRFDVFLQISLWLLVSVQQHTCIEGCLQAIEEGFQKSIELATLYKRNKKGICTHLYLAPAFYSLWVITHLTIHPNCQIWHLLPCNFSECGLARGWCS